MSGDVHVRICERVGVRFPHATRLIRGFELEADARRVMDVLPKRFNRFRLTIHPEKTGLIEFKRPLCQKQSTNGKGTFDFLGFTHYWAKTRRGYWVIKRKTARKRLRRFMKAIWTWCRENRHAPVQEQYRTNCAAITNTMVYVAISRGSKWSSSLPSGLGNTG
jgi:RNA-directed DNA polymerase